MASGDTKTNQYLDIAANGGEFPASCCETRSQTLIRQVGERISAVEEEVQELENNPDVVDIVATYADLQAYDTSTLTDKDIIRVLEDETHDNESTYYRYNKSSDSWTYVGSIAGGTTYTAGDGIDITNAIISATNTGLAKVLTSADYNYDSDNDGVNDYVGLWRLEPGIYDLSGLSASEWRADLRDLFSLKSYDYSTAIITRQGTQPLNSVEIYLLFEKQSTMLALGHSGVIVHNVYQGTYYSYTLFNPIPEDNLTSTSTTRPLSANQGKVLKALIDSISQSGSGAPTTSTVGTVGQLYQDTTNGNLYICTDATNPYVWEEVGGGGITPVQTTGTSTTDVMSQNATTSMIYASPANMKHIRIGENAKAQGSDDSISIGVGSSTIADYSMALGRGAGVPSPGRCAVAIGQTASAGGPYSVALGAEARTGNVRGVVAIGVLTANGYNSSNYRLITGVYDGQSAHDAATYGQLSTAIINGGTTAPTTATIGAVGTLYSAVVSNTAHLYACTAIDDTTDPQNPSYTWTTLV